MPYEGVLPIILERDVMGKYKRYLRHLGEATERSVAVCPLVIHPEQGMGWLRVRGMSGLIGVGAPKGSGKEHRRCDAEFF